MICIHVTPATFKDLISHTFIVFVDTGNGYILTSTMG